MPDGFAIKREFHPDIKLVTIKAQKLEKLIIENLSIIRFEIGKL